MKTVGLSNDQHSLYVPRSSNEHLHDLDSSLSSADPASDTTPLERTMQMGFLALSGNLPIARSNTWDDAIRHCRTVIESPQDTEQRAHGEWSRSCSVVCKELLTRFGPATAECARIGCEAFINDKYQGRALDVAHIDKKANSKRYLHEQKASTTSAQACDIFSSKSSILATVCYEQSALCCSILLSAWLPTELAVKMATVAHVAICDDYHAFTSTETDVRANMIAVAVGAMCESDGRLESLVVDATALQSPGTGPVLNISSIMAWRAVGGGATPLNSYVWGSSSLEHGLVAPVVAMAMHDLLDWRCDIAAQNHENGVMALYGLGDKHPFHTYLEAMLYKACTHPVSGAYAMAGVVHLHFTAIRYGPYHYRFQGRGPGACQKCIQLLQVITKESGLQWAPEPPPDSFAAGEPFRHSSRRAVSHFESHPRAQYGISWLQHLIVSGRIWLFDALVDVDQVDHTAEWA
ncbi:hypothetical protein BDW62DRAFT_198838 [Aspergillus aurantiobrunneus]